MANVINLNKLRDEIDNRKKEKNIPTTPTSSGQVGASPRHAFLNGLLESINTGRETNASALIKTVENKVAEKNGETPKISAPRSIQTEQAPRHIPQRINEVEMSPERDEQLFVDLEKRRNKTLAESIASYSHAPMVGAPMNNQVQPTNINEGYLVENVKKIIDNYLVENFAPVIEETIKSTIIEMYAVERIKEVLHENKDLIRTVVIETIREIQAKSKAKG
jgi:hypothetical protein